MADMPSSQVQQSLPASTTAMQRVIVDILKQRCVARMGQGPVLGTNDQPSAACRICMENLAGELNMRHVVDGHTASADPDSTPSLACQRTMHLACLLQWAESSIRQNEPVMCPNDRQVLISKEEGEDLNAQFPVYITPDHIIRDIDGAVRFWDWVNAAVNDPPFCTYTIQRVEPEYILRLAGLGKDVGFIHASMVQHLPLVPQARARVDELARIVTRLPRFGTQRRRRVKKYPYYIYMEHERELTDHEAGRERTDFLLMPATRADRRTIGRYLQGFMGQIYEISRAYDDGTYMVSKKFLKDAEVINLSAETEIRKRLLQRRMTIDPPPVGPWFWPLSNDFGGIVVGGVLPDHEHPARGYRLDEFNLGQSNDARFAMIAATNPMATQMRDRLVNDYEQGNLPPGFPNGWGLDGHMVVNLDANGQPGTQINPVPPAITQTQAPPPQAAFQPAPLVAAPQPQIQAPPPPPPAPQPHTPDVPTNAFGVPFISNQFTQQPLDQPRLPQNLFYNPLDPTQAGSRPQNQAPQFGQPGQPGIGPNPFGQPTGLPFGNIPLDQLPPFSAGREGINTHRPSHPDGFAPPVPHQRPFGAPNPHPFGPEWTFQTMQLQRQQQIQQGLQPQPLPTPEEQAREIREYRQQRQRELQQRQATLDHLMQRIQHDHDLRNQLQQQGLINLPQPQPPQQPPAQHHHHHGHHNNQTGQLNVHLPTAPANALLPQGALGYIDPRQNLDDDSENDSAVSDGDVAVWSDGEVM